MTAHNQNECLKQIKISSSLHTCARIAKMPSNISTMEEMKVPFLGRPFISAQYKQSCQMSEHTAKPSKVGGAGSSFYFKHNWQWKFFQFSFDLKFIPVYYMSEKSCPFSYSEFTMQDGQCFLDIWYKQSSRCSHLAKNTW